MSNKHVQENVDKLKCLEEQLESATKMLTPISQQAQQAIMNLEKSRDLEKQPVRAQLDMTLLSAEAFKEFAHQTYDMLLKAAYTAIRLYDDNNINHRNIEQMTSIEANPEHICTHQLRPIPGRKQMTEFLKEMQDRFQKVQCDAMKDMIREHCERKKHEQKDSGYGSIEMTEFLKEMQDRFQKVQCDAMKDMIREHCERKKHEQKDSGYGSIGLRVLSENEILVAHPTDDTSVCECECCIGMSEIHLEQGRSDKTNVPGFDA